MLRHHKGSKRKLARTSKSQIAINAAKDILGQAVRPVFELLETRRLLTTVYVNDNWVVTNDQGADGLDAGDTVESSGLGDNPETFQSGLKYGDASNNDPSTNAFSTIGDAMAFANSANG